MILLHSGLFLYNFDPVASDDRGVQFPSRIDLGQFGDKPGPLPVQTVVVRFQRLSSKQSPRDASTTDHIRAGPRSCPTSRRLDSAVQPHETNPTGIRNQVNITWPASGMNQLIPQRNMVIMNTLRNDPIVLAEPEKRGFAADSSKKSEFISVPVGSFAGTLERVIRIRNGQPVAADTGDQGAGQN
jgi:hypothetical protein